MSDELLSALGRLQTPALPKELSERVLAEAQMALRASQQGAAPRTKTEKAVFALVVLVCLLQGSWLVAFFEGMARSAGR